MNRSMRVLFSVIFFISPFFLSAQPINSVDMKSANSAVSSEFNAN